MSTVPALQGIVSDIPMPTETRGERIKRERAEQEAIKKQAKLEKGKPVTKQKASLLDNDQTITYTPEKKPFVLIDLPKIGRFLKARLSTPKKRITYSLMAFGILILMVFSIMNSMKDDPAVAVKESASTPIHIVSTPSSKTTISPKTETKKVGVPVASKEVTAPAVATPAPEPEVVATTHDYTVQEGESLWTIAEREYGDGTQWTRIWEANKDTLSANDIRNVSAPGHWIHTGQVLTLEE